MCQFPRAAQLNRGLRSSGLFGFLALLRAGRPPPRRKRKPAANGGWQDRTRHDLALQDAAAQGFGRHDSGRQNLGRQDLAPQDLVPQDLAPQDLDRQDIGRQGRHELSRQELGPHDLDMPDPRMQDLAFEALEPAARVETRKPSPTKPRGRGKKPAAPAARRDAADGYLAAHGLEKSYGGRRVVNGVSLYVRRGEAVGLLGPNGAGKTTAFYTITGLIKPERGQIELDGYDVTHLPMYQRARLGIGYLPQEASIFRGLNVEQNIRAVLEVVEPNRRQREAELNALLEEFDITARRKTPTIALSGGERRRVEIARALASRPNYMLLDEPFAGIDPKAVVEIQRLVRQLTNRGIGVLITDHNVRETLALTDRSYIIYSGEVLMEGRKDDIVNDPQVRQLYLGEDFRI